MSEKDKYVIQPIFKGMRLRKFKSGEDYKDGLRLTSKSDVGITFPFETSHNEIVDGVKTILGYSYGRKVFVYWIPKFIRFKEMLFAKKPIRIVNKNFKLADTLDSLKMPITTFFKRIKRNFIYDHSSILNAAFPKFNDISKWNSPIAFKGIDSFILEWLNLIIVNPVNESNKYLKTSMFMYGGGIKSFHDKILIGIRINTTNQNMVKFINPSITTIPRLIKSNVENYIPMIIMKSLIFGKMGLKDDPFLLKLYELLKDTAIVFYNNRGVGFIYNTEDDQNIKKLEGVEVLTRFKTLYRSIITTNDPTSPDIEEEIDDEERSLVNTAAPDEDSEDVDKEFDDTIDMIVNSKHVSKIVEKNLKSMGFSSNKKEEGDEIINEEEDDDENTEIDEFQEEEEIVDENNEEEEEIDSGMLENDGDNEDGEIESEDIKELISSIDKENKPVRSKAQEQRLEIVREKYKSIVVDGRTFQEILEDSKSKIIEENTSPISTIDESLKKSTLIDLEKSYVKNTLERDILNTVKSFSNNKSINIHVVDMTKVDTSDQTTAKYTYSFKLVDDKNKKHSIKIDIPKIDKDGFLLIGGNRKLLKKQLTLLPIVKIKPDTVMISSNYNKCFIFRHGTTLTRGMSALQKLLSKDLLNNDKFKIYGGDNSKGNLAYVTNIEYDTLSSKFHKFTIGSSPLNSCDYIFNQKELRDIISKKFEEYKFKPEILPVGIDWKNKKVIDINLSEDSVCDKIFKDIERFEVIKDIFNIISSMNIAKRRMYTRVEVQSKDYALIAFLGGLYGLSKVINIEKMSVEFTEKKLSGDPRLFIKFNDGYLYYEDTNVSTSLLLNGLAYMPTEDYSLSDFDTEKPYIEYFYDITKSRNVFKGHTAFKDLFIDNITEEVLKDLGLPTDFLEVFLYSNSLLSDNSYKNETSLENYRIRGYENIATILYKTISAQYRLYKQSSSGMGRISIQQDQILVGLHKSFILENYDSTNPINELKNKSVVTFKGPGGVNNDRVFTLAKRAYDFSAIGTIAISSVDGGGVGIVKQMTLNPNIRSTRGYIDACTSIEDVKGLKLGKIASPEEADVPFVNFHDDPKRIGIMSAQSKHIIKIKGATIPVISTGMDKSSPYLVGDTFVPKAEMDGVVEKIDTEKGLLIVKYIDGTSKSIGIGLDIQRNSSFFFGNNIVPNVKEGQKVKKGDVLGYESDFFSKDIFGNVRGTQGALAKLVLHEKSTTDEDSSTITERLSDKLKTTIILRKQISLSKNANILSSKKVGDYVHKGDPILIFEDSEDDETTELLATLGDVDEDILASAKQTPKANATGKIVNMKVYYSAPLEEYSDSVYKFIQDWFKSVKSNIKLEKTHNVTDIEHEILLKPTKPTQTGTTSRINGAIVNNDGAILIEYYIEHDSSMSVGDKITFMSNIKSIVAQVIPYGQEPVTEDGVVLDGCLSLFSVYARMCMSPVLAGVATHALVESTKRVARKYLES